MSCFSTFQLILMEPQCNGNTTIDTLCTVAAALNGLLMATVGGL